MLDPAEGAEGLTGGVHLDSFLVGEQHRTVLNRDALRAEKQLRSPQP